ncbi:polymeric immunoglobulin receptor-like [Poecilia formosa]|uniref:polymeric immunoglobulin receptor-like n=1 Tax=Poecilia formosa TaxID=48698 RepID=UPI0007B8EF55|nr:PREDICTED: polymeric immunoglobulin receptor-like [Poecilia formosa]
MWSFQVMLFILSAAVCCVSRAAGLIHVFGYKGRNVNVSCPYNEGYESYEKYLCNDPCRNKDVLTRSQKHQNKYSTYDDKTSRIFTVTISDLRLDDAGKYWCGVTRKGLIDLYTEVKLEVKEDRCCDTVNQTQSTEEGSVTISCPYDSQSVNKLKFFCRGNRPSTCLQQAVITSSNTQDGRFRLSDDRKSGIFTVTISSLTLKDSGSYLCGVQRNSGFDVFTAVELEVKELESYNIRGIEGRPVTLQCPNSGQQHDNRKFLCKGDQHRCCDTVNNIQGNEDGSVTISCPYDYHSIDKLKFFCRGNRPSTCLQQAVITSSNTQDGRFRLSDDRKSRIFTVTISSLTLKDSGSYLCGVQRNSGFDAFTAVQLEVKELESYNISGIEGRPVTLQCPNSGQQHDNRKFLCKGDQHNSCTDMMENQTKFKLLNVSSSCFSVIITELEAADAGTYYCGSDSQLRFIKIQLAVALWLQPALLNRLHHSHHHINLT